MSAGEASKATSLSVHLGAVWSRHCSSAETLEQFQCASIIPRRIDLVFHHQPLSDHPPVRTKSHSTLCYGVIQPWPSHMCHTHLMDSPIALHKALVALMLLELEPISCTIMDPFLNCPRVICSSITMKPWTCQRALNDHLLESPIGLLSTRFQTESTRHLI